MTVTNPNNQTPGFKTPGFWLSVAAIVAAALLAAGIFPVSGQVAVMGGIFVSALAANGYDGSRAKAKLAKLANSDKAVWKRTESIIVTGSVILQGLVASGTIESEGVWPKVVAGLLAVFNAFGFRVRAAKVAKK